MLTGGWRSVSFLRGGAASLDEVEEEESEVESEVEVEGGIKISCWSESPFSIRLGGDWAKGPALVTQRDKEQRLMRSGSTKHRMEVRQSCSTLCVVDDEEMREWRLWCGVCARVTRRQGVYEGGWGGSSKGGGLAGLSRLLHTQRRPLATSLIVDSLPVQQQLRPRQPIC